MTFLPVPLAMRGRDEGAELEMGEPDVYNALRAGDGGSSRQSLVMLPIAFMWQAAGNNSASGAWETDHTPTLPRSQSIAVAVNQRVQDWKVRRLMPVECARLQGFPDDWNDWLADGPRYRQFGNAVAVPVAEYIGRRILEAAA